MSGYLINKFEIVDSDMFEKYVEKVMPIIARHGGQVIVGNESAHLLEGTSAGMNVVIVFPTEADAIGFYESPEYQPVKDIRLKSTRNGVAVVSGSFGA